MSNTINGDIVIGPVIIREGQKATVRERVSGALGKGKSYLEQNKGYFFGGVKLLVGSVVGILSTIGLALKESFFKDNQTVQFASLGGIAIAIGTWIAGIMDYSKTARENKNREDIQAGSEFPISDETISNNIINAIRGVQAHDPKFLGEDITSSIYSFNKGTNLADPAIELIKALNVAFNGELKYITGKENNGSDFLIPNVNPSGKPIPLMKLKEELGLLLGYSVFARTGTPVSSDLIAMLPDNEIDAALANKLPDYFVVIYNAARNYENNHLNKQDTYKKAYEYTDLFNLKNHIVNSGESIRNPALEYLKKVCDEHNYINLLSDAIKYARKSHSQDEDPRRVALVRAALICGFRLKGSDVNHVIDQLRGILGDPVKYDSDGKAIVGSGTGVSAKLDEEKIEFEKLREVFDDTNFPRQIVSKSIPWLSNNLIQFVPR